jgi:hypothetical protein
MVEFVDLEVVSSRDLALSGTTTSFSGTMYSYYMRWKLILPLKWELPPTEITSLCLLSLPTDFLEGDYFVIRLILNWLFWDFASFVLASVFWRKMPVDLDNLAIS